MYCHTYVLAQCVITIINTHHCVSVVKAWNKEYLFQVYRIRTVFSGVAKGDSDGYGICDNVLLIFNSIPSLSSKEDTPTLPKYEVQTFLALARSTVVRFQPWIPHTGVQSVSIKEKYKAVDWKRMRSSLPTQTYPNFHSQHPPCTQIPPKPTQTILTTLAMYANPTQTYTHNTRHVCKSQTPMIIIMERSNKQTQTDIIKVLSDRQTDKL